MKDDRLTIAAMGVLAMVLTTVDHEVIGHGSACIFGGGSVLHISTTLFACSKPSPFVALGGPLFDFSIGVLAWLVGSTIPAKRTGWRVFLLAIFAFSLFWESGYLMKAMLVRDGDLYFFARAWLGQPETMWRIACGVVGLAVYLLTLRLAEMRLAAIFGDSGRAKSGARTLWLAATVFAIIAALAFKGDQATLFWPNLRDAALEIGLASAPLLFIPRTEQDGETPEVKRNWPAIGFTACLFIAFTAIMGHGIGTF